MKDTLTKMIAQNPFVSFSLQFTKQQQQKRQTKKFVLKLKKLLLQTRVNQSNQLSVNQFYLFILVIAHWNTEFNKIWRVIRNNKPWKFYLRFGLKLSFFHILLTLRLECKAGISWNSNICQFLDQISHQHQVFL